jgi:hypothetical protein
MIFRISFWIIKIYIAIKRVRINNFSNINRPNTIFHLKSVNTWGRVEQFSLSFNIFNSDKMSKRQTIVDKAQKLDILLHHWHPS